VWDKIIRYPSTTCYAKVKCKCCESQLVPVFSEVLSTHTFAYPPKNSPIFQSLLPFQSIFQAFRINRSMVWEAVLMNPRLKRAEKSWRYNEKKLVNSSEKYAHVNRQWNLFLTSMSLKEAEDRFIKIYDNRFDYPYKVRHRIEIIA